MPRSKKVREVGKCALRLSGVMFSNAVIAALYPYVSSSTMFFDHV